MHHCSTCIHKIPSAWRPAPLAHYRSIRLPFARSTTPLFFSVFSVNYPITSRSFVMAQSPHQDNQQAEEEEEEEEDEEEEAPSHLPFAPPSSELELSELPTTIDPSYIISLIRRLLPSETQAGQQSSEGLEDLGSNKASLVNCWDEVEDHLSDNQGSSVTANELSHETQEQPSTCNANDGMKDPWEDCGCILWDLAADKTHAEYMVDNYLLEVLIANLHVSRSARVKEICLGIIGNLACHESLSVKLATTSGLIDAVIEQMFLDDSACLSEAFRLLAASLHSSSFASWAEAMLPEKILSRLLWIVGNTLNSTLFEKSLELLLAIAERQETGTTLLQPLIKPGLSLVLTGILRCELSKLKDEHKVERSAFLDLIVRLVEEISSTDGFLPVISSNEELFELVCSIVDLPDKFELAGICSSAVVIIANCVADEQQLSLKLSQDYSFIEGLLDSLPVISEDAAARNALWCILDELLKHIQNERNMDVLNKYAVLILQKSSLVEQDLEIRRTENGNELQLEDNGALRNSSLVPTALSRIASILGNWWNSHERDPEGFEDAGAKVSKLLDFFRKQST